LQTKSFPFEVKVNIDKDEFEGYTSTYDRDLVGDQVVHGAFSKTIEEQFKQTNKIKILWQHDPYTPLGKPSHMEEDSKGLYVVGKLTTKDNPEAKKALSLMRDGIIDSLSIGYDVIQDDFVKDLSSDSETRLLKEIKLYEFSPVTFPANPNATITGVKNSFHTMIGDLANPMFIRHLKEGRALSKANIDRLRTAIDSLTEILNIAEGKSFEPGKDSHSNIEPDYKEFTRLADEILNYAKGGQ
jgi:uncharacterized protein